MSDMGINEIPVDEMAQYDVECNVKYLIDMYEGGSIDTYRLLFIQKTICNLIDNAIEKKGDWDA